MAYAVRFPKSLANVLEQTWRFDPDVQNPELDYLDLQQSIIDRHELLPEILSDYLKPGDLVLEAGCGSCRWVHHLNRRGYRAVGVDHSSLILRIMSRRDPSMHLAAGNVLALPFRSESFDAVLSSYVFEHFQRGPLPALRESYRVLKPGGLLFFIVPFNNLLRRFVTNRLLDAAYYYRGNGDLGFVEYRFGLRECRRALLAGGFDPLCFRADDCFSDWNKGVTVDYRNLQFYWPELPPLRQAFVLPAWAHRIFSAALRLYPWSCCGGITCVAEKKEQE